MLFTTIIASVAIMTGAANVAASPEATPVADSKIAELGPVVGQPIPHDLALPLAAGGVADLESLSGEKGLALFFVRSVDWCPFCKKQAVEVSERIADFRARGLEVAFVSYDTVEKQNAFARKNDFEPALLSDAKVEAINAFGLRNEAHAEGSRFYGIPHPAVFILDREGVVTAKFYEADFMVNDKSYRNRPAVDIILEGLDTLGSEEAVAD